MPKANDSLTDLIGYLDQEILGTLSAESQHKLIQKITNLKQCLKDDVPNELGWAIQLRNAGQEVLDNWEHSQLAKSVNNLESLIVEFDSGVPSPMVKLQNSIKNLSSYCHDSLVPVLVDSESYSQLEPIIKVMLKKIQSLSNVIAWYEYRN